MGRFISKITAKLTGTSTPETFDVRDSLALHGEFTSIGELTTSNPVIEYGTTYKFIYLELLGDSTNVNRVHACSIVPYSLILARSSSMEILLDATRVTGVGTFSTGCILSLSNTSISLSGQFSNGWTFYKVRCYGIT